MAGAIITSFIIHKLFQNAHFKSTEIAERLYALCKENGIKGATDSISIVSLDGVIRQCCNVILTF
jgi:hypothetical protein